MTKVNLKEKLKFKGSEAIEKNRKIEEKFQWSDLKIIKYISS